MSEKFARDVASGVFSRRDFIKSCAAVSAGIAFPGLSQAAQSADRQLSFHHLHTGEKLKLTYWEAGQYVPESLREINQLLRDFRTGEHHRIDPRLFDLLYGLQTKLGSKGSFEIISAYRSPKTNEMLRHSSSGVAKKSLHMQGQAIDIRLAGVDLKHLHQAALQAKVGGVGLYSRSNFIHVDTGRVRTWGS